MQANRGYDIFVVNTVIERLVDDEQETFSAADAKLLIETIPIVKNKGLSLQYQGTKSSGSVEGNAAGVGNVKIDNEEKKNFSLNMPKEARIGGYVIEHYKGHMIISLMWRDTHESMEGKSCRLIYNKRTGEPKRLDIMVEKAIKIFKFTMSFGHYVPWKLPA